MGVLSSLQPQKVFRYFEELCAIPHGSGNCKALSDYCVAFAKQRGYEWQQDKALNVIIKKPASPGFEDRRPVIFQGHLDMVTEKAADCQKDMAAEGLDLCVDGDWIYAKGTTLGGDDGIAVAMALALLDSDDISHPPLEVLLTTEEEVGMLGASALDGAFLQGRTLLNADSEAEGVFTVSCAGGATAVCALEAKPVPFSGLTATVTVSGLVGGHSGIEIHKGRANANVLIGRILQGLSCPFRLMEAYGGGKDNAIAASAWAKLALEEEGDLAAELAQLENAFRAEFGAAEPGLSCTVTFSHGEGTCWSREDTLCCVRQLRELPNGVQKMSADIPGLVQTSLNMGIWELKGGVCRTAHSVRSSVEREKRLLLEQLQSIMNNLSGAVAVSGEYAAWEYRKDSPLRDTVVQVYREQYGKEPVVEAIHAGLECGVLAEKLPGLDAVSFGPNMQEIHTPREKLSISSVQRVWDLTLEVLKRLK